MTYCTHCWRRSLLLPTLCLFSLSFLVLVAGVSVIEQTCPSVVPASKTLLSTQTQSNVVPGLNPETQTGKYSSSFPIELSDNLQESVWPYSKGVNSFIVEQYWYDSYKRKIRRRKDYDATVRKILKELNIVDVSSAIGFPCEHIKEQDGALAIWGTHWSHSFGDDGRILQKLVSEYRRMCRNYGFHPSKLVKTFNGVFRRFPDSTVINMIPGIVAVLTGKLNFAQTVRRSEIEFETTEFQKDPLDFLPKTFSFPQEYEEWKIYSNSTNTDHWIFKAEDSNEGKGISLIRTKTSPLGMVNHFNANRGKGIVQEYIRNPITTFSEGKKVDLRCWGLITSIDPLKFFVLPDAHIRVARLPYSNDARLFSDAHKCIHVTNLKECNRSPESGKSSTPKSFQSIWHSAALHELNISNHSMRMLWNEKIVPAMLNVILIVLNRTRVISKEVLENRKLHTFQFLAFDILLTDEREVKLLEVNSDGYIGGGLQKLPGGYQFTKDMFMLAGVAEPSHYESWRNRPATNTIFNSIKRFCAERNQNNFEHCCKTLGLFVEENAHKGGWERIFPFPASSNHATPETQFILKHTSLSLNDQLLQEFKSYNTAS